MAAQLLGLLGSTFAGGSAGVLAGGGLSAGQAASNNQIADMLTSFMGIIEQKKKDANVLEKWEAGIRENTSEADVTAAMDRRRKKAEEIKTMGFSANPRGVGIAAGAPAHLQVGERGFPTPPKPRIKGLSL